MKRRREGKTIWNKEWRRD